MWTALKSAFVSNDQRAAPRIKAVGRVVVDSKTYSLENWSTTGILIGGHRDQLVKGQRFKLQVEVESDRGFIIFTAEAVVVRIAGDKLAAQFFMIEKRKKQQILEYFTRVNARR